MAFWFPVNHLPTVSALGDTLRFDPGGYRDPLERFEAGVVGNFDALTLPVQNQRLAKFAVSVVVCSSRIDDWEEKE